MKLLNVNFNGNSNGHAVSDNYVSEFFIRASRAGKRIYKSHLVYSFRTKKCKRATVDVLIRDGFKEQFIELDRTMVEEQVSLNLLTYRKSGLNNGIFIKDNIIIDFHVDEEDREFFIMSTNKRELQRTINVIHNNFESIPKEPVGNVYSLIPDGGGGFRIQNIGSTGLDFERGNYEDNVVTDIDHIVEDLGSDSPCGRLVLINGVPGSGKTSLVRMLTKVVNRTFIYVPSYQVVEWSSPTIISVLNSIKKTNLFPLIFIIEDADSCLVPRQGTDTNVNAISALLNLSDGILGALFDIRIVATTNATLDQYDPAIIRNGRLCKKIDINLLSPQKANEIYKRITKEDKEPFMKEILLADIYKYIKDPTSVKEMDRLQRKRVGFV